MSNQNETPTPETTESTLAGSESVQRVVSPLRLTELRISLNKWGDNAGEYKAKVTYEGEKGAVSLNLSNELSLDLMRFCGGSIKRFSENAALQLQDSIEESIKVSESKAILG